MAWLYAYIQGRLWDQILGGGGGSQAGKILFV